MNEQEKARRYGELLNMQTRVANEISSIKGESIDLDNNQKTKIRNLEMQQYQIMEQLKRLF
jgi:hypothetical protein